MLGIILIAAFLIKEFLSRLKLPVLIGYITIGMILRSIDHFFDLFDHDTENIIHFLAELGVIILLFHIGLESKLHKLLKQFRRATFIGTFEIIISAAFGFLAAYVVLNLGFLISLIVSAALVATSIGVSAGVWEENKKINTNQGQLLMDTAEYDDITGIVMMALLFALAPMITVHKEHSDITIKFVTTVIAFLIKLVLFGFVCILFSRFVEKPTTSFFNRFEKPPQESLTIIAIGLIIAACADLLGFSVAIGAFFAGVIFSKDPHSVKSKTAVTVVYDLFVPFFFISIGLKIQIAGFATAIIPAVILIAAAFLGKFIGSFGSSLLFFSRDTSILLGISMIPRAEVTMIIMQRSLNLQTNPMPNGIYTAMVLTTIATCLIPPLILNRLIKKWL